MTNKEEIKNKMERQLDAAIAQGNFEEAETLTEALYGLEEQKEIEIPEDFAARIIAKAEKGQEKMNQKKSFKGFAVAAAAFVMVLSFGITAYAQGWFQNPISVLEDEKTVVTGENINQDNLDAALAEDAAKEEIYKKTVTTNYPDFVTACEALGLPVIYPEYLNQHSDFATEKGVYASTNDILGTKGVYSDFFNNKKQSISMSLATEDDTDDVIAKFDENMTVENTRTFTTTAGVAYTIYDLVYNDDENKGDTLVQANISINGYLFNMVFWNIEAADIEAALNSVDLTPLQK